MNKAPVVSVCIANFNGLAIIDECLRSVLAQAGAPAIEIIVHDDASTDGSAAHIRQHYPEVRMIESSENVGFCTANNRMADAAVGEYLLLLNNDAALHEDAVATLYTAARECPTPAILGIPQFDADSGRLLDNGCLLDPFLNPVPDTRPGRHEVGLVMGACLWIPRELWNSLGGFPEWFGSIGEDLYLCCLARLMGHPIQSLGSSGYRHHVGSSFGGGKVTEAGLASTFRRRSLSERNKTRVLILTYPSPVFQIILPLHILLLLAEGLAISLLSAQRRIFTEIYLATVRDAWSSRSRLRAARKQIQGKRRIGVGRFFSVFVWVPYKLRMLVRHGLPTLR